MHRFATAAIALASLATVASAGTVNMSFTGSAFGSVFSNGTGSFTYSGAGPLISLSDITAFSFSTSRDLPGINFVSTFSYGLSDLQSLSGAVDGSGNVVSLDFTTSVLAPTSVIGSSPSRGFRTEGANVGVLFGFLGDEITGTMTYSSVPTPGAIGVLAGAGLFAARRRR